jgi:hypothetical protein
MKAMARKRNMQAVIAKAYEKNARAVRAVARAQRRRAETLRELIAVLLEAERSIGERAARALRSRILFAQDIAHMVDVEAKTLDREAARAEAQALGIKSMPPWTLDRST